MVSQTAIHSFLESGARVPGPARQCASFKTAATFRLESVAAICQTVYPQRCLHGAESGASLSRCRFRITFQEEEVFMSGCKGSLLRAC